MMLPSTGHFKAISCPFFDSGLCERPYCHFRHVKKDVSSSLETNGEILEHLVSEAVKKVLQQKEMLPGPTLEDTTHSLVSKVVDDLLPSTESADPVSTQPKQFKPPSVVPSYKPTPIAELKKRHIPVPYTPRNCSVVQAKRHKSVESSPSPKRVKIISEVYEPLTPTSSQEYNPDVDAHKCVGYSPAPSNNVGISIHSYIPSSIATLNPPTSDYVPSGNHNGYATYEPSGKKHREPEYRPMSGTVVPNESYIPTDKAVLEELDLDDLTSEFELLDEIISEHTLNKITEETSTVQEQSIIDESSYVPTTICAHISSESIENLKCKTVVDDNICTNGTGFEVNTTNGDSLSVSKTDSSKNSKSSRSKSTHRTKSISNDGKGEVSSKSEKERHRSKSSHRSSSSSHHKSKSKSSSSESKSSSSSSKDIKSKEEHKSKSSSSSSRTKDSGSKRSSSNSYKSSSKHRSSTSSDHKSKSKSREKERSSSSSKTHSSKVSSNHANKMTEIVAPIVISDESDNGGSIADADMYLISEDEDEDAITEECFRIFQEYDPTVINTDQTETDQDEAQLPVHERSASEVKCASTKQRVAHDKSKRKGGQFVAPSKRPPTNTAKMLANRYENAKVMQEKKKAQKMADKKERLEKLAIAAAASALIKSKRNERKNNEKNNANVAATAGKVRIAHVPNVSGLLEAKNRVANVVQKQKNRAQIVERHEQHVQNATVAHTAPKGGQRVAHTPPEAILESPLIMPDADAKLPSSVRQTHLNFLVKEFLTYFPKQEAYTKAVEAERIAQNRSKSKMLYACSISSTILRVRKECGHRGIPNTSNTVSHAAMLTGNIKGSWSVLETKKPTLGNIYHHLERYVLNEQELVYNGFPVPIPNSGGSVTVVSHYDRSLPWKGIDRICVRCKKRYTVNREGFSSTVAECMYHHGRLYRSEYDCCHNDAESSGCTVAACHVSHTFEMTNFGFVSTLPPTDEASDGDYGVFALDCEMCFTTKGLELCRVTVIDRMMRTVFERLVRPPNPIIDYATRFSGVTEDTLRGVTTSIQDVQAALLTMFNSKTILVGHSLDSDMKALKIIHPTVVDTSVVFPHKAGPPKKRALRNLASTILDKAIQQGVGGHDSAEDAIIAMELIMHKLREDLKTL